METFEKNVKTLNGIRNARFEYHNQQIHIIVIFLSIRTDRSGQTVQTQIRLLLQEQSDQGLHCLQFPLHLLDALL